MRGDGSWLGSGWAGKFAEENLSLKRYERRPYWMWGEDGTVCALLSWVHASRAERRVKQNRYSSRKVLGGGFLTAKSAKGREGREEERVNHEGLRYTKGNSKAFTTEGTEGHGGKTRVLTRRREGNGGDTIG
jgi:hypothetical protein